jgi:endonuclease YncB( thermonuclease family)
MKPERSIPLFLRLTGMMLLIVSLTNAHASETLTGLQFNASDGELRAGGQMIRLYGIHIPSEAGLCGDSVHGCRDTAYAALADWLDQPAEVECDVLGISSTDAHIVRCHYQESDLGGWLISQGYALADRRAGRLYTRDQQAARNDNAGIWAEMNLVARRD